MEQTIISINTACEVTAAIYLAFNLGLETNEIILCHRTYVQIQRALEQQCDIGRFCIHKQWGKIMYDHHQHINLEQCDNGIAWEMNILQSTWNIFSWQPKNETLHGTDDAGQTPSKLYSEHQPTGDIRCLHPRIIGIVRPRVEYRIDNEQIAKNANHSIKQGSQNLSVGDKNAGFLFFVVLVGR